MNRSQRRLHARRREEWEDKRHLPHDYECLDCDAETRLTQQSPGVFFLAVFHDPTCPAYQAMPTHRSTP